MLLAAVPWTAVANEEGDALSALRQALIDPAHFLESWDPTLVDPCTWFYITCDPNSSVIRIDLGNASLSGSLVSDLGQLSQLQYLEFYGNNITGSIPRSLGNLTNLISLDLFQNKFVGAIPSELSSLSNLRFLRLNENDLTGTIPESLTGLDELEVLNLSYNQLTGLIPVSGVFANFPYKSFKGNPGLHYPDSFFAPAPSPIAPAPSSGL